MSSKSKKTAAETKPKSLSVKKQTLRDLNVPGAREADVKGGVSRAGYAEGESRYCVAMC